MIEDDDLPPVPNRAERRKKKKRKKQKRDREAAPTRRPGTAVVHLGGQEVTLTVPRSYAVRVDIVGYVNVNPARTYAAALAVCMPHLMRPRITYDQCRYDVGLFGGAVLDELAVERELDLDELVEAGHAAFMLLRQGLVLQRQLKEAEGNSPAPAPSTD